MGLKSKILLNKKHTDDAAKNHPLLHIDDNTAAIMTTKKVPRDGSKTIEISQKDVTGIVMKDPSYVSNKTVKNISGKVIGKVKKGKLPKFKNFLNL